jgi:hypothetical protein
MFICAAVALLPDVLWIPYYLHDLKNPVPKERRNVSKLLKNIQLGERPWGIYVEIVFLVGVFTFFLRNIS